MTGWKASTKNTKVGIKQFCDGKCLGEYFDKLKDEKRKI